MMKYVLIPLTVLALTACGDDKNNDPIANIQEATEDRDLQAKDFSSECSVQPLEALLTGIFTAGSAAVKSSRVVYRFEGANVTRTTYLYSEGDCSSDAAIVLRETGEFNVDTDRKTADLGKLIDIEYNKLTAQVTSQAGEDVANSIQLCGNQDWANNSDERDVTLAAADLNCYSAAVPRHNSNIYRVDADVLYFGSNDTANNDESTRPTSLDGNTKFIAQ